MSDDVNWRDYGGEYEPPKSMVGPLFLGVVIQVALLLGIRNLAGFTGDWALLAGQMVGASLPIPLILWFAVMRRREPEGWWKLPAIFLPLSFFLLFPFPAVLPDREAELRKASDSIAAAGERALEKGAEIGPLRRSGATGEAGEVERITLGFMERIAADTRAYQRDIEASGVVSVLTDPGMRTRAGLPAARAKVAAAGALVDRYRQLIASRYAGLPRQIEHADLSPHMRAQMSAGLERNMTRAQDYWRRLWEYERQVITAYGAMLDILERSRWTRRGDLYTFTATADSAAFNRHADELERIGQAEEALDAEQQSRAREVIAGMRRATR
jgi:hypothetical protein